MNEVKGKEVIQEIVNEWSKVYINQVFFDKQIADVWL